MSIDTSKIIHAPVGVGRYTVTAPIVKEDYGLYLKIEGLELPSTYEVDFSNSEHNGTSVTMIGNSDGVLIPSQFISSGKDVFAFLYHVGEDYGRTVFKFRIPNKLRPDRTDETPTPEEQSVIDQAISALNTAVEQTAQDKADADASAQSASASAQSADASRESADESEYNARVYAENAQASATASAQSAQSASQSAENAHDSAVDAQNYAESASGYASDAQGYATTASQKATEAGNSADQAAQIKTDIEGYVSTAQTAAQTATDKAAQASQSATNASNSATTASTKAGEASASATTASNKASEASGYATTASDKATEASGYANTASQKASDASDSASAALGYKTDAESAKTAAQTAQGLAESARDGAVQAKTDVQNIADGIDTRLVDVEADVIKAFPTDTASGAVASFPDGADDLPLKSLVVNIDPVQDLNGYSYPWPAGGGKNKFNGTFSQGYWAYADGGWVYSNGWIATEKIPCKPSTYYTVSADEKITRWQGFVWYDSTGAYLGTSNEQSNVNVGLTKQSPSDAAFMVFNIAGYPGSTSTISISDVTHLQIEEGQQASDYTPYSNICPISGWTGMQLNANGTVIPISWQTEAGTVYGGTLDVTTGELTVDRAMVDLGAKNWYPSTAAGRTRFRTSITDIERISSPNVRASLLCSNYQTKTANQTYQGTTGVSLQQNSADIYIYDPQTESMTTAEFKSAMSGVQLCYKLATPQTYQLTPTEVATLLGDNTIWADTGDTEVEYRADPDLYIQRKMPEVPVDDVQINGTSIVEDGVANVPIATTTSAGAMSAQDKGRLDDVYADYSSALTALGVI